MIYRLDGHIVRANGIKPGAKAGGLAGVLGNAPKIGSFGEYRVADWETVREGLNADPLDVIILLGSGKLLLHLLRNVQWRAAEFHGEVPGLVRGLEAPKGPVFRQNLPQDPLGCR